VLTSLKNPKVAAVARLKKRAFRERDRRFLVEGAHAVGEALQESPPALVSLLVGEGLDELAVRARQAGVDVEEVSGEVLRKLTSTVTPQPVLGIAPFVDVPLGALRGGDACVGILHEVRDPGNAGTVLRSADAAGAAGLVFTSASVDVYNPKTVRASAGSIFHVPVVRGEPAGEAIGTLRDRGYRILAMDAQGTENVYATDLGGAVAFVFGNEAHGLPQEIVARADATVRVPHAGRAESLNLAAAATVCLFEWARRRIGHGATLDGLIAAAAHDIRSPLTAMKGFGYALERRWDEIDPEQRALMLRGIVHDADRMDHIVRLLVDAARVTGGSLELFPEQVDLGDLVAGVAEAQARDPEHPAISWSGDPGPYFVDPARIKTALLAFLESLVWWGSEGPIRVAGERRDGNLHLVAVRATDDLDVAGAEALFAARRPGTGGGSKIGLYVARAVAEAQGGRAWAEVADGDLSLHLEVPVPG